MSDDYALKIEKESFKLIKFFYQFYKNFNKAQFQALDYYKGMGYFSINQYLRDKKFEDLFLYDEKSYIDFFYKIIFTIKSIDNIFNRVKPYNEALTVYRGLSDCQQIKNSIYILEKVKLGTIIKYPTYLSTSLNINKALMFVSYKSETQNFNKKKEVSITNKIYCDDIQNYFGKKHYYLMKINIPKNHKILYLEILHKKNKRTIIKNWENEILLPRDCKLKLIKRYDRDFVYFSKNYDLNDILKNKVKHRTTRVYEFEYIGSDDPSPVSDNIEYLDVKKSTHDKKISKMLKEILSEKEKEIKELESKKWDN